MKIKEAILKVGVMICIMFTVSIAYAQPGGGGIGGGQGGPNPPAAPIDGGAGIFLAAITGYAYRKLKSQKDK